MPRRNKKVAGDANDAGSAVASITYPARRKNIPPAGLEAHGVVREAPTVNYAFNPHLPPVLRSSPDPATADRLPELLAASRQRPLTEEEADVLADALRRHEPWLEWSGKRERPWFEVEVMASLARREDLAGKVQMIYVDPPYGISFRSNFQPDLGNIQPRDHQRDLSREPETIKAYRDTWTFHGLMWV